MVGNELAPRTNVQTIFATIVVISGALLSAFIFGNMAALMATMNRKSNHFDEIHDLFSTITRSMRLPEELMDQAYEYLIQLQDSPYLQQDIERFFQILSDPLKKQIKAQLYLPLLRKIKLLENANSSEMVFFLMNITVSFYLPNEVIVVEGTYGDSLFFISKGRAEVFIDRKKKDGEIV